MRNLFSGETLFLLGNGPSLNNYDLELLAGKFTMCFNRFYLAYVSWYPTIYTVSDEAIIQDYGAEINRYINHIEYPFFPELHPSGVDFSEHVSDEFIAWYDLRWGKFFLKSKEPVFGLNHTVASVGLQLAYWLGFKTIYLLGVDMDFKIPEDATKIDSRTYVSESDGINHFTPEYYTKGSRFHMPDIDVMIRLFGRLTSLLKENGVRVVNLNPDSKFRECEFGDYERALE